MRSITTMMTMGATLVALGAWLAASSTARADELGPSAEATIPKHESHEYDVHPSEPPTETRWYGWQNGLVDAATIGLMVEGVNTNSGGAGWIGLVGWAIGSPIVHIAHERGGAAIASLGMRVGFPFLGGVIGSASCSNGHQEDGWGCFGAVAGGVLFGGVIAMIVDDAALAHETVKKEPEPWVTPTASIVRAPDGKSATPTFGLAGVF
jgi:hypothetical protein